MTKTISSRRKFYRHKRVVFPAVEFDLALVIMTVCLKACNHIWGDNPGEEVIDDNPLVMPAYNLLYGAKVEMGMIIGNAIMKGQHEPLKL